MLRTVLLLVVLHVVVLVPACTAEDPAPDPHLMAELTAVVPAGWYQDPPVIPNGQDAWPALGRARSKLIDIPTSDGPLCTAYYAASAGRHVSEEQVRLLASWLEQQREALGLLDKASSFAGLNRRSSNPDSNLHWISTIRALADLLRVNACVNSARGHYASAWKDLWSLHRLATWAARASISSIDDILAGALEMSAYKALAGVAIDDGDVDALITALGNLPQDQDVHISAVIHRMVANSDHLRALAAVPKDMHDFAAQLRHGADRMALVEAAALAKDPSTAAIRSHPDIDLIEACTKPFDAVDSLRQEMAWCQTFTASVPDSWAGFQQFRNSAAGQFFHAHGGSAIDAITQGAHLLEVVSSRLGKPPDPAEVSRKQVQMMTDLQMVLDHESNPIGYLLAGGQVSVCQYYISTAIDMEACKRLARIALAIALVRIRTGAVPDALSVLAAPDLLGSVPTDPYNGQAFHYDAHQGLVWSVGKDLVDDGGDRRKDLVIEVKHYHPEKAP